MAAYKSRFGRAPRLGEVWAFPQGNVWQGQWDAEWDEHQRGECNVNLCAMAKRTGKDECLNAFGGVELRHVRVVFDGKRINELQTPSDLDMEDGDAVDILMEAGGC